MFSRLSVLAAAMLAVALPAHAADAPSLIGKWTGLVEGAVMAGSTPDRQAAPGNKVTFSDEAIAFSLDITDQHGSRFGGEMSNAKRSETLIGQLYPDHKSGIMLDDDGRYSFTLRDAHTMDVCYDHLKPDSKVIACWTARRPQ